MSPRIVRVFPRRTSHTPRDPMVFIGNPPLFRPEADEVHVSVAFTWDLPEARRLERAWGDYYPTVKIGGPALGHQTALNFVPGRYIKRGVTFTTRGCDRVCPWCLVPKREGRLIEIDQFEKGWIIQDNNFLQASQPHQLRVFDMLRALPNDPEFRRYCKQKRTAGIEFAGGIDARLVNPWFAAQLTTFNFHQIFLAADTALAVRELDKARGLLAEIPRNKLRAYTLIGFGNDTIPKATKRLERVYGLDCIPHAQLYQPADRHIEYSTAWRALARLWSRPALMNSVHRKATETVQQIKMIAGDK